MINEVPFNELYQKAKDCSSVEEILEVTKAGGVELTDEELDVISGGWGSEKEPHCPYCDGTQFTHCSEGEVDGTTTRSWLRCWKCGREFDPGKAVYK